MSREYLKSPRSQTNKMEAAFLNPKALGSHSPDYSYHGCLATQPWQCDTNNAERQQRFPALHVCSGSPGLCRWGSEQRRSCSPWNPSLQEIGVGNQRQGPFLSTGSHTIAGALISHSKVVYICVFWVFFCSPNIIIH